MSRPQVDRFFLRGEQVNVIESVVAKEEKGSRGVSAFNAEVVRSPISRDGP